MQLAQLEVWPSHEGQINGLQSRVLEHRVTVGIWPQCGRVESGGQGSLAGELGTFGCGHLKTRTPITGWGVNTVFPCPRINFEASSIRKTTEANALRHRGQSFDVHAVGELMGHSG